MLFDQKDFPNLRPDNYRSDGPAADDGRYNCIAWAAGRNDRIWDPVPDEPKDNFYWPKGVPLNYDLASLVMAYETEGFVAEKADGRPVQGSLEYGIEKIALYADDEEYMHAARQLANGKWTSKMGKKGERIEHDTPENLEGPAYGQIAKYMQRKRPEDQV